MQREVFIARIISAAASIALGGSAALAQDTNAVAGVNDWAPQQQGDLKWAHVLVPAGILDCSGAAILAAQERDPTLEAKMQTDVSGYACYFLRLRSEATQRIQCNLRFELPGTNPKKPVVVEEDVVLDPQSERYALETLAPASTTPRPASRCFAIPETASVYKPRPECRGEMNVPPPSRYYPAGSKRREEEGDVVLDYTVVKKSTLPMDVRVVKSSGFADLDTAALKIAGNSAMKHLCPNQRYRLKISFKLAD